MDDGHAGLGGPGVQVPGAARLAATANPPDQPDFSNSASFMPLGVATPGTAPVVYSVAARLAFGDGSVAEWLAYLAREQGFQAETIVPFILGHGGPGVTCLATQPADDGPMRVRIVLFEDAGRLVVITAMAPEPMWPSVSPLLERMVESYTLLDPGGPKAPLTPAGAKPKTYADFALSADASTLDENHPTNAYFRDNGIGLVPRVASVDTPAKSATLGCGAIEAMLTIPLGWHAVDDGQRTLFFDKSDGVQINFNLADPQGRSLDDVTGEIVADVLKEHPRAEHLKTDLDGTPALLFRGMVDNGTPLQQAYLFRPHPGRPGVLLKVRVTAAGEDMGRAMNLTEIVMRDLKFAGQ